MAVSSITTLSLTGKQKINPISLTGKSLYSNLSSSTPYNTKIKRIIFDRFITPILSKNWKILRENVFQINEIIKRLDKYYQNTNDETMIVYKYMLTIIKTSIDLNEELDDLENKIFQNDTDVAKMIVKVPRIRLRPELELYNLIIGKPEKNAYNKKIVDYIFSLLKKEYITYNELCDKVKEL